MPRHGNGCKTHTQSQHLQQKKQQLDPYGPLQPGPFCCRVLTSLQTQTLTTQVAAVAAMKCDASQGWCRTGERQSASISFTTWQRSTAMSRTRTAAASQGTRQRCKMSSMCAAGMTRPASWYVLVTAAHASRKSQAAKWCLRWEAMQHRQAATLVAECMQHRLATTVADLQAVHAPPTMETDKVSLGKTGHTAQQASTGSTCRRKAEASLWAGAYWVSPSPAGLYHCLPCYLALNGHFLFVVQCASGLVAQKHKL